MIPLAIGLFVAFWAVNIGAAMIAMSISTASCRDPVPRPPLPGG